MKNRRYTAMIKPTTSYQPASKKHKTTYRAECPTCKIMVLADKKGDGAFRVHCLKCGYIETLYVSTETAKAMKDFETGK